MKTPTLVLLTISLLGFASFAKTVDLHPRKAESKELKLPPTPPPNTAERCKQKNVKEYDTETYSVKCSTEDGKVDREAFENTHMDSMQKRMMPEPPRPSANRAEEDGRVRGGVFFDPLDSSKPGSR